MIIILISNVPNLLQVNPENRPVIQNVLKKLKATTVLIAKDPKIEDDWKSFHSFIKVPAEFKVDERTQCSQDLLKELTQISLKANNGQMVTGGTKLHDQNDTNLCAYFATMSALRQQLKKIVGSEKTRRGRKTGIGEYLNLKDQAEKRFERDLAVMIGCVCPRALSARFKIIFYDI